ncbi:hypothetical protein JYU34_007894 [Plutella xylostella]|uniref:Sphingomyelin phosphodiesterase 4 n=1 Tax=Plutella xylostella TaxID=51655 RepID=A0ABQ7QRK6_PLUXY|nr:hypothetical protein JYU34_007894 [Plutella xylostella]
MAQDVMSKFYTILNLPLYEKLNELTKLIDSSPNKELQALFPQLISNIFGSSCYNNGWGLRSVTCEAQPQEYALLLAFLAPGGALLRLAARLLPEPAPRYTLPLHALPLEMQTRLRRGGGAQLYADMLTLDAASSVVALALNPFDYYMLNFALHLLSADQNKSSWESWNSAYLALACDYLQHFLPAGGGAPPPLPHGAGKPRAAPLQPATRQCSPSLLLQPELAGLHAAGGGAEWGGAGGAEWGRGGAGEWRSESVLQLFLDVWMSVDDAPGNMEQQRAPCSPERVRVARVCVKAVHAYCAGPGAGGAGGAAGAGALRQYARQLLWARGVRLVRRLVDSWPLDASFRLVLELWLSLIQPWRYTGADVLHDREAEGAETAARGAGHGAAPEGAALAARVAEALPAWSCALAAVLPRFLRQDLANYKNAVMLFRIGKVFSQPNLVPILRDLEQAIMDNGVGLYYHNPDESWNNNSNFEYSGGPGGGAAGAEGWAARWAGLARQARAELCPDCRHAPLWPPPGAAAPAPLPAELLRRVHAARAQAERAARDDAAREQQDKGVWSSVQRWLGLAGAAGGAGGEARRTPALLAAAAQQFEQIFGVSECNLPPESLLGDSGLDQSSFANSTTFPMSITNKLRSPPTGVQYAGDPDLLPVASYESTILVRILYQISTRINEIYGEQLSRAWARADLAGCVARAALAAPAGGAGGGRGARVSLRALGSLPVLVRLALGYAAARALSYSGAAYVAFLLVAYGLFVFAKAIVNYVKLVRS